MTESVFLERAAGGYPLAPVVPSSSPVPAPVGGGEEDPGTPAPVPPPNQWSPMAGAGHTAAAGAMSEAELEAAIRRILKDLPQVMAYHTRNSIGSHHGFPDWCFCGPAGLMFRELKRESGRVTPAQAAWLAALRGAGQSADVWRPVDLLIGRVGRELAALAGYGGAL